MFEQLRYYRPVFDISEWQVQCNPDSCWEHITDEGNIYLCVSPMVLVYAVCVFVCVWYKTGTNVPRLDMCRAVLSLSKLTR